MTEMTYGTEAVDSTARAYVGHQDALRAGSTGARLLRGVARGGPRDGVRLDAPSDWCGRVRNPSLGRAIATTDGRRIGGGDFPGHYEWSAATWTWVSDETEVVTSRPEPAPAPTPVPTTDGVMRLTNMPKGLTHEEDW